MLHTACIQFKVYLNVKYHKVWAEFYIQKGHTEKKGKKRFINVRGQTKKSHGKIHHEITKCFCAARNTEDTKCTAIRNVYYSLNFKVEITVHQF